MTDTTGISGSKRGETEEECIDYNEYLIICEFGTLKIREGGVVSAKMFAFLTFHFCKRYQTLFFPEPNIVASVAKATTVHSQQLSQYPT